MNIVGIVHVIIYLFLFFGMFSSNLSIIWTHLIMTFTVLVHWALNDNKCIFTEIECAIFDIDEEFTLTNRLLEPLLDQASDVVIVVTVIGLTLSVFKLYWLCDAAANDMSQWYRMKI